MSLCVTELLWSWEIQVDWLTIELLKWRVCTEVKRLVDLVNLNLYDISSTYMRWTHNWFIFWTHDTQRSCVVRQTIICTDRDIHCGTCCHSTSVDNVEPYELFQCSDVNVKNDPYVLYCDWKDWRQIPDMRYYLHDKSGYPAKNNSHAYVVAQVWLCWIVARVWVTSIYIRIRSIYWITLPFNKKILKLLCGDLLKSLSHFSVNPQTAIGQLVDSVSEIGADWVIAS